MDNTRFNAGLYLVLYKFTKEKEGFLMVKTLAKLAEKTAKSNNAACWIIGAIHQPKMPASLVKKD